MSEAQRALKDFESKKFLLKKKSLFKFKRCVNIGVFCYTSGTIYNSLLGAKKFSNLTQLMIIRKSSNLSEIRRIS